MWKEWFNFSKTQQLGVLVLTILVVVSALFPTIHKTFFYKPFVPLDANSFQKVDSFFNSLDYLQQTKAKRFSFTDEERKVKPEPETFAFDPNTVSATQLVRLGLTASQAATIEKYRNKGGVFKTPNDFAKMYVVDAPMFKRLKAYIKIEKTEIIDSTRSYTSTAIAQSYKSEPPLHIELNAADTLELTKIRGIGRSYARRIISYRKLLGGYHSVNQLVEVYGFSSDLLEQIKPSIWADTSLVNKIDINLAEFQTLRTHPYLTNYQAKAIIYYRETMENFTSLDELTKHKLVDKETLEKIRPYLDIIE